MSSPLTRIDAFCDAVPRRHATVHDDGPLRLFVRTGPGFPLYARPVPGAGPVTVADVDRMRARQHRAGVVEAFEWMPAASPGAGEAIAASGLSVGSHPLLTLDGEPGPAPLPPGCTARLLAADDPDLADAVHGISVVGAAAFGAPLPQPPDAAALAAVRADLAVGGVRVLVTGPDGPVAAGQVQVAGPTDRSRGAELVGISTDAAHRGRGLGAAVTALLAGAVRANGAALVFLAAADEDATRVYERVGFRRVGECGIAEA